jgi:hypothetical protein
MLSAIHALTVIVGTAVLTGAGILALIWFCDVTMPRLVAYAGHVRARYRLWRTDCGYSPWRALWWSL